MTNILDFKICQREGLYQVDLLSPAAEKITQQEYHAQRRGQLNLDMANMEIMAEGIAPMKTKFETNKEKIRNAINPPYKSTPRVNSRYNLPADASCYIADASYYIASDI